MRKKGWGSSGPVLRKGDAHVNLLPLWTLKARHSVGGRARHTIRMGSHGASTVHTSTLQYVRMDITGECCSIYVVTLQARGAVAHPWSLRRENMLSHCRPLLPVTLL